VRSAYLFRATYVFHRVAISCKYFSFLGGEFHEDGDNFRRILYFSRVTLELLFEIRRT
jgi:hypothetical protein